MATRKTTTKANTKTTKKPAARTRTAAAKTTRTVKSTKVTKKTTDNKTVVKAAAVSNNKRTELTSNALRRLQFVKTFVFAALAAAAAFFMNNTSYGVGVGHQAKDELLSLTAGNTAFVHASQNLFDIEIRWIVTFILGLAALFSLLAATRLRRRYEATLVDGVSSMRWIGWGIITALMVETIALLSGVNDIFVLKIVAGLMLVTCALAWVAEKRNKQAGRPAWSEFSVSLVTGSLPWLLIGGYAVATWVWGLVRYPWFVYALYASTLIGFTLLTINQYKRISSWKNTLVVERNYLLIALATKSAFAIILILAFKK